MDKGVIENFYHIRIMDEYDLDKTNTFIVKVLSKPSGPLLYIYLDFKKKWIAFSNVYTIKNQYLTLINVH